MSLVPLPNNRESGPHFKAGAHLGESFTLPELPAEVSPELAEYFVTANPERESTVIAPWQVDSYALVAEDRERMGDRLQQRELAVNQTQQTIAEINRTRREALTASMNERMSRGIRPAAISPQEQEDIKTWSVQQNVLGSILSIRTEAVENARLAYQRLGGVSVQPTVEETPQPGFDTLQGKIELAAVGEPTMQGLSPITVNNGVAEVVFEESATGPKPSVDTPTAVAGLPVRTPRSNQMGMSFTSPPPDISPQ